MVFNINSSVDFEINDWEHWKDIYSVIDALLSKFEIKEDCHIRTFQSFTFENKWLGFGRMKWNLGNNKKWTSKYKTKEFANKNLIFLGTEVWSPHWDKVTSTVYPPNFFLKIYNESTNKGIIIAIPIRMYKRNSEFIEQSVGKIKTLIPAEESTVFKRYWTSFSIFQNDLQDITYQEISNARRNRDTEIT